MADQRVSLVGRQGVARVNGADVSVLFAYGSVRVALLSGALTTFRWRGPFKTDIAEWTDSFKLLSNENHIQ